MSKPKRAERIAPHDKALSSMSDVYRAPSAAGSAGLATGSISETYIVFNELNLWI